MSRILVVGINYAPEHIGTGKYTAEMCEWLASRGHKVRVVTTPPYYPEWKRWSKYRGMRFTHQMLRGVEVIRCPIWIPANPSGLSRVFHLASFALTASMALLYSVKWKPDWAISIAPTISVAPSVLLYSLLTNTRTWLHIQDFELDAAFGLGLLSAGKLRKLVERVEKRVLNKFNVVSTISTGMFELLRKKGIAPEKCELFPNWANIDEITPLDAPSPYRAELDIPTNAIVALYSGNMGAKQGLTVLSDAVASTVDVENLYFVFGGDGPAKQGLQAACSAYSNVRFLDLQPRERLRDWLGLADIHLLPQRADVADLVMPSKLTGMLASGRPIIATAEDGTSLGAAVGGRGIVIPPADAAALSNALRVLAANSNMREQLGHAARIFAEQVLSRDLTLQKLEARLVA